IRIRKGYTYRQTSPSAIALDTATNNYHFTAKVLGPGMTGITPPLISGPVVQSNYCCWNNGRMEYNNDPDEPGWYRGSNANNYGVATLSQLNTTFPNAVWTITVNGIAVPLNLTGNAYPAAPVI